MKWRGGLGPLFITLYMQRERDKVIGVGVHSLCRIDSDVTDANTKSTVKIKKSAQMSGTKHN